jgi:uncharacterized protein with FMN-binding domain
VRRVILAVTGTIVGLVLLLGFKTTSATSASPKAAAIVPGSEGGSSSSSSSSGTSSSGSGSSGSGSTGTKTVTGDSVDTRWGPVQVKITVTNGKITSAQAVDYPENNPRDEQINSFAIPQLQQETLAASSANIDMVSGATYTSQGYIGSLQSALDKV